uniref:Uncharacterized protein n=1 Tax=Myoviridae sp. ctdyF5 TaxID=2825144 RepID=A0A8S5U7L5_9CAUD|nr:MAG TPA: hypothetical protein [Myoviridae sp. ctdyF5]
MAATKSNQQESETSLRRGFFMACIQRAFLIFTPHNGQSVPLSINYTRHFPNVEVEHASYESNRWT